MNNPELLKGFTADVEVVELEENFEQFKNTRSPDAKVTHCHKTLFRIMEDGSGYAGQFCSDAPTAPYAVGDIINLTIKTHTKGLYSFSLNAVNPVKGPGSEVTNFQGDDMPAQSKLLFLNGTPGELGLRYSLQYWANRVEATPETIFEYADKFREYLVKHSH